MVAALEVFRRAGALAQIERLVLVEAVAAPLNPAPGGKRKRLAPAQPSGTLQMTTNFSEPVAAVKRGTGFLPKLQIAPRHGLAG